MLITKLSGLLRRLLRSTDHFVTLREELEAIDEYLHIEVDPVRPAAATSIKQIHPTTLDVIVPSLILQPLVENSIKHGLSPKVGGGRITITSRLRNGHVDHRSRGRRPGHDRGAAGARARAAASA